MGNPNQVIIAGLSCLMGNQWLSQSELEVTVVSYLMGKRTNVLVNLFSKGKLLSFMSQQYRVSHLK